MKGKYIVAALVLAGAAAFYFFRKRGIQAPVQPQKENERHHLTTAFSKAKQLATRQ